MTRVEAAAIRHDTAIGIDVGGTSIKAAPVELATGRLLADPFRRATPAPATPTAVVDVVAELVEACGDWLHVGVAVPAVVRKGITWSAANIDPLWVGAHVAELVGSVTGRHAVVLNDADAAGLAELHHGAARGCHGLVVVVTLGTGIGTALMHEGRLVPNSELGHLEMDGADAELAAAASVKTREALDWSQYAMRLRRYLAQLERLLSPDLIVVGGAISADATSFLPLLGLSTPVRAASHRGNAGIVGAALACAGVQTLSVHVRDTRFAPCLAV